MTRLFTPPSRVERRGDTHRLFGRLTINRGVSLLKEGGVYRQVTNPSDEEIKAADWTYLGGHVYLVTNHEGDLLTAAGYGQWVTKTLGGYGSGNYGSGGYGTSPAMDVTPGYGSGLYGGGIYGED